MYEVACDGGDLLVVAFPVTARKRFDYAGLMIKFQVLPGG